ncbi:thioredoxin family protein [Salinimicrobium oceani]|uniref:Thioredoxin family protein n=1 Tax=Salinimicrobium oceani TaxID=2722702 RepID=A0ABX1CX12_9FLAO|nr:thioredoxin family protein [Salinimicrobium oceani]NJW51899.1 thioredoxin family protein [Salinimicrobium oceani]
MKIFLYFLLIVTAANCGSSQQHEEKKAASPETEVNEEGQETLLVGDIERKDLEQAQFATWFHPMYKSYKPEAKALETIREHINDYEILMFMGTWCADSQREVPKFLKLLDLTEFDQENLKIKAVREDKTLPDEEQKEYDVVYVPTMIFFKDGKEVGRFVEYPQDELEIDIAKIVSGKEYRHSYE